MLLDIKGLSESDMALYTTLIGSDSSNKLSADNGKPVPVSWAFIFILLFDGSSLQKKSWSLRHAAQLQWLMQWHNLQHSLHVHNYYFLGEIISSFCCPWYFNWCNTFHTIVGVQQLEQIKDNNFPVSQFSFLSEPRTLFLQTGVILRR